jgi:Domain of unknown function (DUF4268)
MNLTRKNKNIFDALVQKKQEIEKSFGSTLSWERLDDKRACRVCYVLEEAREKGAEGTRPPAHYGIALGKRALPQSSAERRFNHCSPASQAVKISSQPGTDRHVAQLIHS